MFPGRSRRNCPVFDIQRGIHKHPRQKWKNRSFIILLNVADSLFFFYFCLFVFVLFCFLVVLFFFISFVCFFLHLNYPSHTDFVDCTCQEKKYQASFWDRDKKSQLDMSNYEGPPILSNLLLIGLSPALHLSSAAGHENCVHILLRLHNADGSLQDCLGQTALDLALKPAVLRIFESLGPWLHLLITI